MKCPKCGALTVVDPNHCYVRCLSCGWYERANEYNDMTCKPNPSHQPRRTSCGVGLDGVVGIPNQEKA
jgi:hypothetical protein